MATERSRLLQRAKRHPFFTAAEVRALGIDSKQLTRLVREGTIERVGRGRYRVPGAEFTQHHSLVLAAAAVPAGVICLLSALLFHDVGTQLPRNVWMALPRGAWTPRVDDPPVRIVHFSGAAFAEGVEEHRLEGRAVRVYCLPKTIADCFKFRNKIGLDVALEALTDAWRRRRVRLSEIERYARICRVLNVMRPYLEALAA